MISVCIATYNGEKYLKQQLDSILPQLAYRDEVIIVDDCSSDSTVSIIEGYNDRRIRLIRNKKNIGPVKSFEVALAESSGDFVFLSDQDDVWLENKVQKTMDIFEKNNCDIVISDAYLINDNNDIIFESFFKMRNSGKGIIKNILRNSYVGCTMAVNRKILEKALPFPSNIPMHDMWIGLVGEIFGKTFFLKDKLVYYRRHCGNTTSLKRSSIRNVLIWRINLIACLLKISFIRL